MSTTVHWTLSDYDRMIEAGLFDGAVRRRVELVYGEVCEMTPIGPLHLEAVMRLSEWSYGSVPAGRARVLVQGPIGIPELESVPEPDIAWVVPRDYSRSRPTAAEVLLVIEVAESSLAYDRGAKADLYAAAGIAEYWVVDLPAQVVEVYREPVAGHYRSLHTFSGDDEVRPLCFPEVVLRPGTLL
jgi:Uma2 family endonuclease